MTPHKLPLAGVNLLRRIVLGGGLGVDRRSKNNKGDLFTEEENEVIMIERAEKNERRRREKVGLSRKKRVEKIAGVQAYHLPLPALRATEHA